MEALSASQLKWPLFSVHKVSSNTKEDAWPILGQWTAGKIKSAIGKEGEGERHRERKREMGDSGSLHISCLHWGKDLTQLESSILLRWRRALPNTESTFFGHSGLMTALMSPKMKKSLAGAGSGMCVHRGREEAADLSNIRSYSVIYQRFSSFFPFWAESEPIAVHDLIKVSLCINTSCDSDG